MKKKEKKAMYLTLVGSVLYRLPVNARECIRKSCFYMDTNLRGNFSGDSERGSIFLLIE